MKGIAFKYEDYHKVIDGILLKRCTLHKELFPNESPWMPATEEYFYVNDKNKTIGLHPECKKCTIRKVELKKEEDPKTFKRKKADSNKKVYYENPEKREYQIEWANKQREEGYQSDWRQRNPEKCRWYASLHRNHDITPSEERALLEVFNYSCAYCGMSLEEHKKIFKQKLHNDHVDDNGYNDLRNDVPSCKSCNTSKHESELEDWYPRQKFYSEERYNKIVWWITEGYKLYIEDKPPYKIIRKQNEDKRTFHWELWSVDEQRNMIECMDRANKKNDLNLSKYQ